MRPISQSSLSAACAGAQPVRADVGHAVALGVGAPAPRLPGEVGAETVRRGQAGPLADQHQHRLGAERFAQRVAQRHPPLGGDRDRSHAFQPPGQAGEQRGGVALHGGGRQPVAQQDGEPAGRGRQAAGVAQPAAEIGAAAGRSAGPGRRCGPRWRPARRRAAPPAGPQYRGRRARRRGRRRGRPGTPDGPRSAARCRRGRAPPGPG